MEKWQKGKEERRKDKTERQKEENATRRKY